MTPRELGPVAMTAMMALAAAGLHAAPVVAPAGTLVSADDLRARVEAHVRERLAESGSGARIVEVGGLADRTVPPGELRVEVGAIAGRLPRARVPVPVTLRVDGRRVAVLTAWVALSDVRRVQLYADAAPAHTPTRALRLVDGEVDMTCCPGSRAVALDELQGKRLARAARAGTPVLDGDLEPMPQVARHEPVRIGVTRGAVQLSAPGMALADGHLGERVPVHAEGGETPVLARVTGEQEVTLDD